MKPRQDAHDVPLQAVAPHAGAWIETCSPWRVAGRTLVAPHAGAWIETLQVHERPVAERPSHPTRVRGLKLAFLALRYAPCPVAPHAGAWIETIVLCKACPASSSHPTRVRGLKPKQYSANNAHLLSHPTRVRGLKPDPTRPRLPSPMSHPTRVRGLKQFSEVLQTAEGTSHPTRVRGLKLVRPRMPSVSPRRTPRGCVD